MSRLRAWCKTIVTCNVKIRLLQNFAPSPRFNYIHNGHGLRSLIYTFAESRQQTAGSHGRSRSKLKNDYSDELMGQSVISNPNQSVVATKPKQVHINLQALASQTLRWTSWAIEFFRPEIVIVVSHSKWLFSSCVMKMIELFLCKNINHFVIG